MSKFDDDPLARAFGARRAHKTAQGASVPTVALRKMIQGWLRENPHGGTAEEIADALRVDYLDAQRRLSELKGRGQVQQTSTSRPTRRGRAAKVWEIA